MGFIDAVGGTFKKIAGSNNPNLNNNLNQLQNEGYTRNPNANPNFNPNALADMDNNGVADVLETRDTKPFNKAGPNSKFQPFSFKSPTKDYNVSFDHKGKYVPTATYPLPPLSHEKKMLDRNKRMRNGQNKFI